jgi:hypothetical protein
MQTFKALTLAATGMLIAGAATAVTVKNTSKSDVTIGIDWKPSRRPSPYLSSARRAAA